jgi:type IX secretion system PorP/SprF family membrane protein
MAFYNENTNKLPMKITAHAGYNIDFNGGYMESDAELSKFYMSVNALYQQQGPYHQVNAGVFVTRYPLVIGGWYRFNFENPDAFIALVGLTYKNMKLGYSYDFTTSELGMNSGGAHEVSFAWQFDCYENKRRIKAIPSPSF